MFEAPGGSEPDARAALGNDFMCDDNLCSIITAGFLDVGEQLQQSTLQTLVDRLRRRRTDTALGLPA